MIYIFQIKNIDLAKFLINYLQIARAHETSGSNSFRDASNLNVRQDVFFNDHVAKN